jgi:hypothetical protein
VKILAIGYGADGVEWEFLEGDDGTVFRMVQMVFVY